MNALITLRQLYGRTVGSSLRYPETGRALLSTTSLVRKGRQDVEESEIEAADPFLSKLQQQTEASYLELLSRKDQVPQTEDDQAAEEAEELRNRERGEWGGPQGKEPTRFGDWEKAGRCSDF